MDKSPKKYGWASYAVPVIIFLIASALYFAPQFQGKTLEMGDYVQYRGAVAENDRHYEQTGEDPQWNSSMFSGMPSYLLDFKIPGRFVRWVSKLPVQAMGEPAVLIFSAMLCFWLMLLLWGVNPWVGTVAALAYGFSTYTILIIGAGHISKVWAMAYAPLLAGAVAYSYRGGYIWFGGATAALGAALTISANHPQITYYFLIVIAALAINELVRAFREKALKRFWKVTGVLTLAAALAVGANFGNLYYTMHHAPVTTRGGSELAPQDPIAQRGLDLEYATAWSYGKAESFNMLIPSMYGGQSYGGFSKDGEVAQALSDYGARALATSLPGYWGEQPMTAGPTYIGAAVLFLAVLALVLLEGRRKWWILAVSVFALFLSWGSNMMWFTELMFRILPGYNKFRAVSTALVIVQWSMPLLAALILMQLWKAKLSRERVIHGVKWAAGITGGLALFFALFGGWIFGFTSSGDYPMMYEMAMRSGFGDAASKQFAGDITNAMSAERLSMMRGDAWRSLLFVVMAAGTVLLFAFDKIKRGAMVALLAGIVTIDLVAVNVRYLSWDDFKPARRALVTASEADKYIMGDAEPGFRVANFTVSTFNDATTSFFHRSIGGYHGAKLQRYQDLIDRHLGRMNMEVYNMLNTKYFIVPGEDGRPVPQLNPDANGAAWFVDTIVTVDNANDEIDALNYIDTRREAVVNSSHHGGIPTGIEPDGDVPSIIALTEYNPNHLTYQYTAAQPGIAVFSEIYYNRGWNAYIDGEPAEYFRADYVLRAMALPEGEHTVEFVFSAPNFRPVVAVTSVCSLAILLGFVASAVWIVVGRRKGQHGDGND